MDALGIVYPQYWLQPNCEMSLSKHIHVIKTTFCSRFWRDEDEIFMYKILNVNDLDNQQNMFKLRRKSNLATCMVPPFDINLLTKMWHLMATSQVHICKFPKYVKLAKLVMVQIVSNLENQKYFFTLVLTKSNFYNKVTTHLPHIMCRFCITILHYVKFPTCKMHWIIEKNTCYNG
jgi:hypothetical protein